MAIFPSGVLDRNDLAAGTEDPEDFPAQFMRIWNGGDDIRGHDGIKAIIREFQITSVHDMEFNFMAVLVGGQTFSGFTDHALGNIDPHNMGVGRIELETGTGADAYFQNFLMGAVGKIFEGFSSTGF
jgi:hypothetical protein